jgi:uncharacterized repeat protein (TIGR03809 family)
MTERPASRQLGKVAQKWRGLAEKRRAYYAELYRSGRWKLYYTEDEMLKRIREVVGASERWGQIAPSEPALTQTEQPVQVVRRNAA